MSISSREKRINLQQVDQLAIFESKMLIMASPIDAGHEIDLIFGIFPHRFIMTRTSK